jgi:hypothetical protein
MPAIFTRHERKRRFTLQDFSNVEDEKSYLTDIEGISDKCNQNVENILRILYDENPKPVVTFFCLCTKKKKIPL